MSEAPDDFRDAIRDAVLASLDTAAGKLGVPGKSPGATDADLPPLFRALDAQAQRLWVRIIEQTNARSREETTAILAGRACLISQKDHYLAFGEYVR